MNDDDALRHTLHQTLERLAWAEADDAARRKALDDAQQSLRLIRQHRNRGRVPMWESAQRAGLRTVVLALGCVLVVAGAMSLDSTAGGVAIVGVFVVMAVEGSR